VVSSDVAVMIAWNHGEARDGLVMELVYLHANHTQAKSGLRTKLPFLVPCKRYYPDW
jgi:hypothetical protein